MSAAPSLIALLADGAWHSGPTLARTLGVTRAAVSARVAELRQLGLDIYSVAGRGYRLRAPIELLDADTIRTSLPAAASAYLEVLDVRERVDSTSAQLAREADGRVRACLAEYQSAGRGRSQRPWTSPFGANLYVSLACTVRAARAPIGALSLAVGAQLAAALVHAGARGVGLKWPNDLWAGDRKLGGILIEHRGEVGGDARLILGVGVNVAMQPEQAESVDQPWTRLVDHLDAPVSRNRLAALVLAAMIEAARGFERDGFDGFRDAWARFDVARDRPVRLIEHDGRERYGIARGIAGDGALQVDIGGERVAVYSGDVSLRVAS